MSCGVSKQLPDSGAAASLAVELDRDLQPKKVSTNMDEHQVENLEFLT
jgi:hypothetical protein